MNKMIRIYISVLSLFCAVGAFAQNDKGKTDDIGRIVLNPYVVSNANIPSYAVSVVENKLTQIATKQGMAGVAADMRFVITANLVEESKEITATAPPMIAMKLIPTIYIGDIVTGDLYSSCELPAIRGVGDNETKAYMNAVKAIKVNHPTVIQCINEGKEKIIEYYNSQIDFILAEAESMSQSQKFEEAILKLAAVPTICKDAYTKAFAKIGEIYQKKIDIEGEKLYNQANATWKTSKTKESASKVVELLAEINPISSAAEKGRVLVKEVEKRYAEIEARRKEIEDRNWAFKVTQYNDAQQNLIAKRENAHEYRMTKVNFDYEVQMEQAKNAHEYRMTKANFDYEVQMEQAKNGNAAAEYALREVKETVAMMSPNANKSVVSKFVDKINYWFK